MTTVNEQGLKEIREFLAENHKRGDNFSRSMLLAWARDAEFQLSEGNPASIEIRAADSVTGATREYTISHEGLDRSVLVEYMPEWLVESHRAAGHWGEYPGNGALREWMSADAAHELIDADADGYARLVQA